jgi:oxygen-independent coproporphyrinogen-3 oxidase
MKAGLYVHLPYCASRCGYCAFVVTTDSSSEEAYVAALEREIALAGREASGARFDTVYLGGGTPSLLSPERIARLLGKIIGEFEIEPGAEVTLEANPEDVTEEKRDAWIRAGVTRFSVGVQSFDDRELAAVGRRHDAARARQALATLSGAGPSLSGDLILGLPGQSGATFRSSVEAMCAAGVDHVSVYLLEVEKSPALEEDRRRHPWRYAPDDEQAELWLELSESMGRGGFEHYEISNWARPGRQSRHNVKYWTRAPTLGLGVSAHEFWNGRRRVNVSTIPAYVERIASGKRAVAVDRAVSPEEAAGERIVLGLRLAAGVERREVDGWVARHGDPRLSEDLETWLEGGLLEESDGRLRFSERGFLLSNEVLCRFV